MNASYTWLLARKILLALLILVIISSIIALFVRNRITQKLEDISKLTVRFDDDQSKPEKALLLLHQSENDFQESLLNSDSKKSIDYKQKLSMAFNLIDTLLKEHTDTAHLTAVQRDEIKIWHHKKLKLSNGLFVLKHNFDSLLTFYSGFNSTLDENLNQGHTVQTHKENKDNTDTVRKVIAGPKKGLFGRIKDAISNKSSNSIIEINHAKTSIGIDQVSKQISTKDKDAYARKFQQLQQQNVKLLNMQRGLISLNSHISNELEQIINDLKEINYHMADKFKEIAFKNYQETTALLNRLYLIALFLVLVFATLLAIFIIQLNKAELLLREENDRSVSRAQQKIAELIKKIELSEGNPSPSKMEELKEIVQLVISNNPAFLVKFNEYDSDFCKKLMDISPNLVAAEIGFCVLLRLNFETKEIARYTKTSVRAVEGKKYRIRRKLNIPSDHDINIWMTNI